jgi:hypothetical protein
VVPAHPKIEMEPRVHESSTNAVLIRVSMFHHGYISQSCFGNFLRAILIRGVQGFWGGQILDLFT